MTKALRRLHAHWYRVEHDTRVYAYGECRCGKRKAWRIGGGHQPIDKHWLRAGA